MTERQRRLTFLGLSAALVVALVAAVLVTMLGSAGSPATASTQESQARKSAQRVASAFAVNVNTYSSDKIQGYRKRVEPLLTDKFRTSFDSAISGIVSQMRSADVSSTGEVLVTGVSAIDKDSATVLVVADADVTTAAGERARHFRWKVDLVRRGGAWRVNGFEPT